MAKGVMGIFAALLWTLCLTGCTNDDNEGRKITDYREDILTAASKRVPGVLDGYNYVSEVYAVKKDQADRWNTYGHIAGFEYKEGYEYIPLPQYRYAVESDNNELIENELTSNPIFSADYRYTYYHSESCMKWIGIQDNSNVFGPYSIKQSGRKPEEMPESYKLLPPDGRVSAAANGHFWIKTETRQTFLHSIYFSDMQTKPKVPAHLQTLSLCIKT